MSFSKSVFVFWSVFSCIALLTSCSTWREKREMIGCYCSGDDLSTKIIGPETFLSITLVSRNWVYAQVPYMGDGGGYLSKDGTRAKLVRRGKWDVSGDTLQLTFKGYDEKLNLLYQIVGDSLIPIKAPQQTIWVKGDCK